MKIYEIFFFFFKLLEAYRKVQSARQKKRQPTKKEKDAVWKILHEREAIMKQLDGWVMLYTNFYEAHDSKCVWSCRTLLSINKQQIWLGLKVLGVGAGKWSIPFPPPLSPLCQYDKHYLLLSSCFSFDQNLKTQMIFWQLRRKKIAPL